MITKTLAITYVIPEGHLKTKSHKDLEILLRSEFLAEIQMMGYSPLGEVQVSVSDDEIRKDRLDYTLTIRAALVHHGQMLHLGCRYWASPSRKSDSEVITAP